MKLMDVMTQKLKNSMRQMELCRFQTKPLNRTIEYFEILQVCGYKWEFMVYVD